jgi:hypothetical protein
MVLSGSMEAILRRVNTSNPLIISILGNKEKALTILKSQPCVQTISVKEGDIINVDVTTILDGYYGDASRRTRRFCFSSWWMRK